MEKDFIKRLQELAGIAKEGFEILYRIDPALEKLGIDDGDDIELGSYEWIDLLSLVYQVPFDGDLEKFGSLIDKKAQEEDFPIKKLENQLDLRDIEVV